MLSEDDGGSAFVDPLANYFGLSLFPRTLGVLPDHSKQYDPACDLDAIHTHLKSMVSRSPSKFLEEANTIIHRNSEILDSEIANDLTLKEKNEESTARIEDNPQERRPGLKRKRARFSLKPKSCQSIENLEPTLDIKQFKDPEEFFLAYERHENAKKEIQKHKGGVSMDLNQPNQSVTVRHRRPGILGRSVRYKHQYSPILSERDVNILSSQELKIISPSSLKSKQELELNDSLTENESNDSRAKINNEAIDILDELLSVNIKDLEGDGAFNLLQERLQIKPIDVENLSLPDFQDIHKVGANSSKGSLTKMKVGFSGIDSLLKRRTPVKPIQESGRSVHHSPSPSSSKSPIASFSSFKRRILGPDLTRDPHPCTIHNIDPFPARKFSSSERTHNNFMSRVTEDDGIVAHKAGSPKVTRDHSQISLTENSKSFDVGIDALISGIHGDVEVHTENNCDGVINEKLSSPCGIVDNLMEKEEGLETAQLVSRALDENSKHLGGPQSPMYVSTSVVLEDHALNGLSSTLDTDLDHQNELSSEKGRKTKVRPCKQPKDKKYSRRQSLQGAGSNWETGVRRSTRIRVRPLEHWRGERLLYWRIHESLATVIGVKYSSPANGGDKRLPLKVKSYVSDEYKELVELAARN